MGQTKGPHLITKVEEANGQTAEDDSEVKP